MELQFTAEQEKALNNLAVHEGKADAAQMLREVGLERLKEEERFRAAVQEGIDAMNRGDFLEEEEVEQLFQRLLAK